MAFMDPQQYGQVVHGAPQVHAMQAAFEPTATAHVQGVMSHDIAYGAPQHQISYAAAAPAQTIAGVQHYSPAGGVPQPVYAAPQANVQEGSYMNVHGAHAAGIQASYPAPAQAYAVPLQTYAAPPTTYSAQPATYSVPAQTIPGAEHLVAPAQHMVQADQSVAPAVHMTAPAQTMQVAPAMHMTVPDAMSSAMPYQLAPTTHVAPQPMHPQAYAQPMQTYAAEPMAHESVHQMMPQQHVGMEYQHVIPQQHEFHQVVHQVDMQHLTPGMEYQQHPISYQVQPQQYAHNPYAPQQYSLPTAASMVAYPAMQPPVQASTQESAPAQAEPAASTAPAEAASAVKTPKTSKKQSKKVSKKKKGCC